MVVLSLHFCEARRQFMELWLQGIRLINIAIKRMISFIVFLRSMINMYMDIISEINGYF